MILAYHKPVSRCLTAAAMLIAMAVATPALAAGAGLAERMGHLQRHTHKLQLAVEARNADLVAYYLHEIEEVAEEIRDGIASYKGQLVGRLTGEMLLPTVEAMEDSAEAGDWAASDAAFSRLLGACNACHTATARDYIRIVPAEGNPFNQDFSKPD